MRPKTKNVLVFILGLGAITEIRLVGSLGISEIVCYLVAPFVFAANLELFKRLRFNMLFLMLALWAMSAVLADYVAQTYFAERWKGIAPIYSIFSVTVCSTVLLADDVRRVRWFLVGSFCSALVASFVFTPAGVAGMVAQSATATNDSAFGYSAWYYGTIGALFQLPVQLAYNNLPLWISLGLVSGGAIVQLLLGGRGAFLIALVSLVFLWFGRRARFGNYRPRRLPVVLLVVAMASVGILAKAIYADVVTKGYMGDAELSKYEAQSQMGTSGLSLLLRGRGQTFIGLFAALEKPFIGHGTKALDTAGYYQKFIDKYGTDEDARMMSEAYRSGVWGIQAHSHVIAAWVWHDLGGLLFWLYVLWLLHKAASVWMWYVPELIGWFAIVLPSMAWNICFSPFGGRTIFAVTIACVLLSRVFAHQARIAAHVKARAQGNES